MGALLYLCILFGLWLVFTVNLHIANLCVGALLSVSAFLLFRSALYGRWIIDFSNTHRKKKAAQSIFLLLIFLPVFLWKVFLSGLKIAVLAMKPGISFWPGIVKIKSGLRTPGSVTLLANLITLTPGTLTLDYHSDSDFYFIHWMDVAEHEDEELDAEVSSGLRPWVRRVLE